MDRRNVLKTLGVAALAKLASPEILAAAQSARATLDESERHLFRALDPLQNETVIVVTELIIPETDTPGARTARVSEFVDVMLSDWFSADERARFLSGLAGLDRDGRRFVHIEPSEQVAILEELERDAIRIQERGGAASDKPARQPFFAVIKWLTIYGYYTSRVGMEQELHYEVFPGSYDGCAPIRKFEA